MSWEDAWREGRSRWDAGQSPPILAALIEEGTLSGGGHALVTGCGSGYDVFTLAKAGYKAFGVDLAPTAARHFHDLREDRGLSTAEADVLIEDFFSLSPEHPFDVIWDYTFLCAIEPQRRADWAAKMRELIAPDGSLFTLLFPVDIEDPTPSTAEDDGPPYRLHPSFVQDILEPSFSLVSLDKVEESHKGREGREWIAHWKPA